MVNRQLRLLGASLLIVTLFAGALIGMVDGISWASNTNGIFYKHKAELKNGDCAMWDLSNEFETHLSFVIVREVGKTHYKLLKPYPVKLQHGIFLDAYESIDYISSIDRNYQKINCQEGINKFIKANNITGADKDEE